MVAERKLSIGFSGMPNPLREMADLLKDDKVDGGTDYSSFKAGFASGDERVTFVDRIFERLDGYPTNKTQLAPNEGRAFGPTPREKKIMSLVGVATLICVSSLMLRGKK